MEMITKLAIFDLDGTLFDTKDVNFEAYNCALGEYGYSLDYEYFCKHCNGGYYRDFIPLVTQSEDTELIEHIHRRKKELYSSFLEKSKINVHLFCFLDKICDEYHIALVTTASKANTFQLLEYHGKTDVFEIIITSEDVVKKKPDPEGFLTAMKYFQVSPQNTVIYEDSQTGVEAALRSGASVYQYLEGTKK